MKQLVIASILASLSAASAFAAPPRFADPFSDSMVLQQGMKVPVWGTADPQANVTVAFAGQTQTGKADAQGAWRVQFNPLKASDQNRVMTLSSGTDKVEIKDVLVGEVWICSGQSNMEFPVFKDPEVSVEAAKANDPSLRLRTMYKVPAPQPRLNIVGSPWKPCTPENLKAGCDPTPSGFSSVAYVFGSKLRKELKVPVGLIEAAWGGTRIEAWTPKGAVPEVPPGATPGGHQLPAVLYQGMIQPWAGFGIRGAIWYQGESNCIQKDGLLYADRMKAMISGWRGEWKQGDFPFYFVQIAPFTYATPDLLPVFWQAQTKAAAEIPVAGMAVTQDVGNWKDIHPPKKTPVGERLARLALSRTYKKKLADDCGPIFKAAKLEGTKVRIAFDNAASGLNASDGKPLVGFELAGEDGNFQPATAETFRNTVVVSCPQVAKPQQVRYGWVMGQDPNLANGEKLPAVTFSAPVK